MRCSGLLLMLTLTLLANAAAAADPATKRIAKADAELSGKDVYQCVVDNRFRTYIVDAKLVTSKDKTHNTLVLKGKAEGKTYCRAGQAAVGETILVHIVVEEADG